ncbi:MAG: polymer-forming cytoskeletal protein [Gemmatimonadota bacterium]
MAKDSRGEGLRRDLSDVVSVVGPGMEIVGDVKSDGTIRVEGRVEGCIRAAKSVVIGKDGVVAGDIETQDVVVAGEVTGTVTGESRVELQETCRIEGDIRSRRIKLDEGGKVEGRLHMGSEAFAPTRRPGGDAPKASQGTEGSPTPYPVASKPA